MSLPACQHPSDGRQMPSQDVPITEVMAVCEASEQKLRDIDVAEFLQLTNSQRDAIAQLQSEYLERCAVVLRGTN